MTDSLLRQLALQDGFDDMDMIFASSVCRAGEAPHEDDGRGGFSVASPGALMQVGASVPCPYGYGCNWYTTPVYYGAPVVYGGHHHRRLPRHRRGRRHPFWW